MKLTTVSAAAALAILSLPAVASHYDRDAAARIDQRQEAQQRRIERGIETGQLTRQEVWRLREGQRHIQRLEDRALADGRIDRWELRRIEAELDRLSTLINRERNDEERRYSSWNDGERRYYN